MTSLHTIFVILIITVGLVLVTGCVGQVENGKSAGNVTSPVPTTSLIPTPAQIESLQVLQEGYWIKIDPISDKHMGDIFTITATTNVSAGEEILFQVYSSTFHTGPKFPINRVLWSNWNCQGYPGNEWN